MQERQPPTPLKAVQRDEPEPLPTLSPQHPVGVLIDVLPRWLVLVDALSLYGLLIAVNLLRFRQPSAPFAPADALVGFALLVLLTIGLLYFAELYSGQLVAGFRGFTVRAFSTVGLSALLFASLSFFIGRQFVPRGNFVAWTLLASLTVVATRSRARKFLTRLSGGRRVAVLGDEAGSLDFRAALEQDPWLQAEIVASTASVRHLVELLNRTPCTHVVLLSSTYLPEVYPDILHTLDDAHIGTLVRISPADTLMGLRHLVEVGGVPLAPLQVHSVPPATLKLKRWFDLVAVALLVLPALLLGLVVAAHLRLRDGGGPLFYRQQRVGMGGRPFTMLKFRTMCGNAELMTGPTLSRREDERLIPGARWVRGMRLDELPQLLNVARGDMSMVGPRPERPEFVREFTSRIPGYQRRHEVPPGLTGLAQINGRYNTDAYHKLGYDLQYVVNCSLLRDLQILAKTLYVCVGRRL
jgi:exopolysaccharide biosynthesis polyprenyl glycosylphosphotransferase